MTGKLYRIIYRHLFEIFLWPLKGQCCMNGLNFFLKKLFLWAFFGKKLYLSQMTALFLWIVASSRPSKVYANGHNLEIVFDVLSANIGGHFLCPECLDGLNKLFFGLWTPLTNKPLHLIPYRLNGIEVRTVGRPFLPPVYALFYHERLRSSWCMFPVFIPLESMALWKVVSDEWQETFPRMFSVKNWASMIPSKMTSDDGPLFDLGPHTWTFKGCFGLGMVWARVPTGRYDVILFGISCTEHSSEKITSSNFTFVASTEFLI